MTHLRPYTTYKPSGVEWLGDVPEQWGVRRLRTIVDVINGATPSTNNAEFWDGNIPWITPDDLGQLPGSYIAEGVRSITEAGYYSCATTIAPAGSVAISTRAPIGHIGVLLRHGCVNQGCRLLVPNKSIESKFLYYRLSSAQLELQSLGQGSTFMELSRGKLADFAIPLPPLPEQAAIVRYLDHTDRRTQRYIDDKERLIALLEEEKQAVINRAVTRGLDPNVPLKPSGVQWLGDVPAHWEVEQLGRIGKFSKGSGGTKEDEVSDGLACVRYGDIYMSHKYFIHQSRSCIAPERAPAYTPIQRGDILFAGSGETLEEIGKSAVNLIESEAYCGGDVILFRPATQANHVFMGYACDSLPAIVQKSQMGRGITVMHIYSSELKYLWVALPPKCEQDAIVAYLETTTTDLDKAIAGARRQIELLREYRTRLISDVVTGKLDVREAAANLPDEGADSNAPILA